MWPSIAFVSDRVPILLDYPIGRLYFRVWMWIYKDKKLPAFIIGNDQSKGAHLN